VIQFPLYEALKSFLSRNYLYGRRPTQGEAAICVSIAGGLASAVTTPLDVVETRVMLEARVSRFSIVLSVNAVAEDV
jgi:solute carrier family 25 S-adenosylmethionine transporter 26